jgi:hypothetical protein
MREFCDLYRTFAGMHLDQIEREEHEREELIAA